MFIRIVSTLALIMLAYVTSAKSETTQCTSITAVPITITTQGVYCFTQNVTTNIATGPAITIAANNVTIDFNNFKLGGASAGPATAAIGVLAQNRKNITLRNANIRGFRIGVYIDENAPGVSSGHVIEDSLFDGSTFVGIWIEGTGIVVRNNRINNTDSTPPAAPGFGVASSGIRSGVNSIGNVEVVSEDGKILTAGSGGPAAGIVAGNLNNGLISGNLITGTISSDSLAFGISVEGISDRVDVANNKILETKGNSTTIGINILSTRQVLVENNAMITGSTETAVAFGIKGSLATVCLNNTVIDFDDAQTNSCAQEFGTIPPAAP